MIPQGLIFQQQSSHREGVEGVCAVTRESCAEEVMAKPDEDSKMSWNWKTSRGKVKPSLLPCIPSSSFFSTRVLAMGANWMGGGMDSILH